MWPFNRKKITRINMVDKSVMDMCLEDWQSNEGLANNAKAALASEPLKLMVQVLKNSHPVFTSAPNQVSMDLCLGYTLAINILMATAYYIPKVNEIEATFSPENIDEMLK